MARCHLLQKSSGSNVDGCWLMVDVGISQLSSKGRSLEDEETSLVELSAIQNVRLLGSWWYICIIGLAFGASAWPWHVEAQEPSTKRLVRCAP